MPRPSNASATAVYGSDSSRTAGSSPPNCAATGLPSTSANPSRGIQSALSQETLMRKLASSSTSATPMRRRKSAYAASISASVSAQRIVASSGIGPASCQPPVKEERALARIRLLLRPQAHLEEPCRDEVAEQRVVSQPRAHRRPAPAGGSRQVEGHAHA